jgi:hypothetical protein
MINPKLLEQARAIAENNKKLRKKAFNKRKKCDTTFTQTAVVPRRKDDSVLIKVRKVRITEQSQFKIKDSKKAGLQLGREK